MTAGENERDGITELPPLSADAHTRDRLRWLDQVLADRELTAFAFAVAYVIAGHVNRETGEAWPSQATIAGKVGSTDRGVRKTVEQLAERGHLAITTPTGRKGGNRYRLILKALSERAGVHRNGGAGNGGFHRNDGSHDPRLHRHSGSGKNPVHRNGGAYEGEAYRNGSAGEDEFHRNGGSDLTGTVVPPIPLREPSDSLSPSRPAPVEPRSSIAKPRKPRPKADEVAFDEWYGLYPRKIAKGTARKAYSAAIGRGVPHADLVAGVRRHAAACAGKDPKFIPHPATWLNGERWADEEPAGPGRPTPSALSGFEVRGVHVPEANILAVIGRWQQGGPWHQPFGPAPDQPGCMIPRPILDRAGVLR